MRELRCASFRGETLRKRQVAIHRVQVQGSNSLGAQAAAGHEILRELEDFSSSLRSQTSLPAPLVGPSLCLWEATGAGAPGSVWVQQTMDRPEPCGVLTN